MKILDTSPIVSGVAMYVKGGTLNFLQLANREMFNELMTSRIGPNYDTIKGYIINGCINSGTGSSYVISAGSVFFNGEIFLVPAASFTISGPNVAVGLITTTQFITDADPTDFTDGNQRNVHNIRQIAFQAGLAGSGAFDFNNSINLAYKPVGAIGQTIEWLMPGSGSQSSLLATYFDAGTLNGIHPLTYGWTIEIGGYFDAVYKAGDANFGTIGGTGGALSHTIVDSEVPKPAGLVPSDDGPHPKPNDGGGVDLFYPTARRSSAIAASTALSLLPQYKTKLKITRYA